MKKIKLFALAVMAMLSTNAFAADEYALDATNGVRYTFASDDANDGLTAANAKSAKVYGPTTAVTSMTIPATFTTSDENGVVKYFKVVGFADGWGNAAVASPAAQVRAKVTDKLTSITIDATNMADGWTANLYANLTALTTLKIKSDNAAHTQTFDVLKNASVKVQESITTIDLSECSKMTAVTTTQFQPNDKRWAKVTSVTLPAALTTIEAKAFMGSKVTSLTIPATVATIGLSAFEESALTAIDLSGTKVTALPTRAFYKAKDLAIATLPADLTTIGQAALAETALTSIEVPAKVTTVDAWAFENCKTLATVTGMTKVTAINNAAFKGCEALTAVAMPAAETIGNEAFMKAGLTAIEIPATVTSIGEKAFEGCEALASFSVAAPAKADAAPVLATIGKSVFKGCTALASADLTNSTIKVLNKKYFEGCTALTAITLPKTIIGILENEFADCAIENLDLSVCEGLGVLRTIFGAHDADNPNPLKSIILPKKLKEIKANVFDYAAITEITLPASLNTDVPAQAFYYCTALKTLNYYPENETNCVEIDQNAFIGCTPRVKINTNSFYFSANTITDPIADVPLNAYFLDTNDLTVTTVKDNGTSGKFFGKYCPQLGVEISKEDLAAAGAKLYSVYVDEDASGQTIYLQALSVRGGKYTIPAFHHVIVKTNEAATLNFQISTTVTYLEDWILNINNLEDVTLEDYQTTVCDALNGVSWIFDDDTNTMPENGYKYLYALTNSAKNGGFGFTYFAGTTLKKGGFFLPFKTAPAAGRINMVWLDEDGNVEDQTTAISAIETADDAEGEMFNLAGQKVDASYKGVVIKNGKKVILK